MQASVVSTLCTNFFARAHILSMFVGGLESCRLISIISKINDNTNLNIHDKTMQRSVRMIYDELEIETFKEYDLFRQNTFRINLERVRNVCHRY